MKVALVHEFLTQLGGAERVLTAFHEIFPQAPVYTLVYDPEKTKGFFDSWDVRVSLLQHLPGNPKNYKWYLPLMPKAIESPNFDEYDLVLSDSSAFAKGIKTRKPTTHITYCHTPTRYLWQDMDFYIRSLKYSTTFKTVVKFYLKNFLKKWDLKASQRPDFFIANSKTVQARIKKYYNRDSEIIYPPVDTEFFIPTTYDLEPKTYFFAASRLEPYKKMDVVIDAFNNLGLPLKVAGEGTEARSLKLKAKSNIEVLGRVSDEQLRSLYEGAKAFIFPALEDAGIMVLEALACGTPVIAYGKGGATEFIRDGENGLLFAEQTSDKIITIVRKLSGTKFDPQKLRESVLQFDKNVFKKRLMLFVQSKM